MSKKKEEPKIRRTWNINPKTQITPNKKSKAPIDDLCDNCDGTGTIRNSLDEGGARTDCQICEGTGLK